MNLILTEKERVYCILTGMLGMCMKVVKLTMSASLTNSKMYMTMYFRSSESRNGIEIDYLGSLQV